MVSNKEQLKKMLKHMTRGLVIATIHSQNIKQVHTEEERKQVAETDMEIGSGVLVNIVDYFVYLGLEKEEATRTAIDVMNEELGKLDE